MTKEADYAPFVPRGLTEMYWPQEDDYVAQFANDCGEEMVFIAKPGIPTATLYHYDLGWVPEAIVGGIAPSVILSWDEIAFVALYWKASAHLRNRDYQATDILPAFPGGGSHSRSRG